jgi:hypothetical protein
MIPITQLVLCLLGVCDLFQLRVQTVISDSPSSCGRGEKLSPGIIINVFFSIAHVFDPNLLVIAS